MSKIDSYTDIIPQEPRNVNIILQPNESLEIKSKTYTKKPSYIMVASGYGAHNMDYTKELLAMTPQEAFVFNLLMDNRDMPDLSRTYIKSNHTYIDNSLLSKSEKKKVYEGYKRLHSKNLVIRIARGKYLINPQLVITNDELYKTEIVEYMKLQAKGNFND